MKKALGPLVLFLAFATLGPAQTLLSQWTFENYFLTNNVTGTTISGLPPAFGIGTASGVHASSSTVFSSPVGNGSLKSISANNWAVGDYWQFQTSTLGYSGISLAWDQTSSQTGPLAFNLSYSTDGINFTVYAANYVVLTNVTTSNNSGSGLSTLFWSSTNLQSAYTISYSLSSVTALDNASTVYFRLVDAAAPSGTAGTDRVDNFTIMAVPEPASLALAALGGLVCFGFAVSRRHP